MLIDTADSFVWPADFACTLVLDNIIVPNYYHLRVSVEPHGRHNNIHLGFKKINYFVNNCLQNGILISKDNFLLKSFENINTNKIILSTEPYDYFLAAVLFQKFSVISEKYFDLNYITIDSLIGDRVEYTIRHSEETGMNIEEENWWTKDSPYTGSGEDCSWDSVNLRDENKFQPRIIEGGLNTK